MTDIIYFLQPFIAFVLIAFGFQFNEKIAGIIGGLLMFLYGVVLTITPIVGIPDLQNIIIAFVCYGYGAYIMIRGGLELMNE
jgi:hypothetical protein